jgi:hypothetical protein
MSLVLFVIVAGLLASGTAGSAMADGFRPSSGLEPAFLEQLPDSTVVVYPANIRDPSSSALSATVRDAFVERLREAGIAGAVAANEVLSLGEPDEGGQWQIFNGSLDKIAEQLRERPAGGDYAVVFDVIFPPARAKQIEVFGLQVYMVTAYGDNAFSFLLNSHHPSFVAATLRTSDNSARGREALALRSVDVAMKALDEQITAARECLAIDAGKGPFPMSSDVVADFEGKLVSTVDRHGVEIGYSTFEGRYSSSTFETTDSHPPRQGEAAGNRVLRIDAEVVRWAGVMQRFENAAGDQWIGYDWTGKTGIEFWFHGGGNGTEIVFDVLDNRYACSTVDDAERFSFEFVDDVPGWRRIKIPFEKMHRKNIGNQAPVDDFGLSAVTGWAIGILQTEGEESFYLDDIQLLPASR